MVSARIGVSSSNAGYTVGGFNSGCDVFCWVLGVCGVFLRRVPRDGFLKTGALHDAVGLVYDLGFGVWCFETSLQGKLGSPPYLLKLMCRVFMWLKRFHRAFGRVL